MEANKDFTISLISTNIKLGVFTNADKNYLSAPQTLDPATNEIVGHTHVTVETITSQTTPPDPTTFAFFKVRLYLMLYTITYVGFNNLQGINTPPNAQGQVSADVTGGLPPGDYRLCTMTSAANHQPVIMPIAQRGSQDDCVRVRTSALSTVAILICPLVQGSSRGCLEWNCQWRCSRWCCRWWCCRWWC